MNHIEERNIKVSRALRYHQDRASKNDRYYACLEKQACQVDLILVALALTRLNLTFLQQYQRDSKNKHMKSHINI